MRIIQSETPRPLNLLAVGPGGLVAVASDAFGVPGGVEVWNVASGARVAVHHGPREFASLAFATGDHVLVSELGDLVTVISARTGQVLSRFGTPPGDTLFAVFPDGIRLLVASRSNQLGSVECWRVNPDLTFLRLWVDPLFIPHTCAALAVNPSGTRAATADRYEWNDGRPRLDVTLRDADTGKVSVRIVLDPSSPVKQLVFTVDGAKVLARTDSHKVQLFDLAIPAAAGELVHPGRPYVTGIAVHPRGPVACARTNGTVTFWNPDTREQLRTFDWKAGRLVSVAFSPDGALAAAGTEDGKIVVWDVDV